MSRRPWYKRFGADFIQGTIELTLEEKGAYSICLDLIYDRGSSVADDPRAIASACGCSVRKWNTIRERLLELGKLTARDGRLHNPRVDRQIIAEISDDKPEINSGISEDKPEINEPAGNENNDLVEKPRGSVPARAVPDARDQITTREIPRTVVEWSEVTTLDPNINPDDDPFRVYREDDLDALQFEFDTLDIRREVPRLWEWTYRIGKRHDNERMSAVYGALSNKREKASMARLAAAEKPPLVYSPELAQQQTNPRRRVAG